MNKNKLLKTSLITLSILALTTVVPVVAMENNSSDTREVFLPVGDGTFIFNPVNAYVKSKGYHNIKGPDGKSMRYKEGYYGDEIMIKAMLPSGFGSSYSNGHYTDKNNGALLDKYVIENSKNVAGQGGDHLINSSDWNWKKGQVADVKHSAGYAGDNSGLVYFNNYWAEPRYIGYLRTDGSVIDNIYLPNDRSNPLDPWLKDWKPFGVQTASGKKHTATIYNSGDFAHVAEKVFTQFIQHSELGKGLVKQDSKWADWRTWNKYFAIQQEPDSLAYQITGFYFQDYIRYQTFSAPTPVDGSTYIMSLDVTEKNVTEAVDKTLFIEMETSTYSVDHVFYQGLRSLEMPKTISSLPTLKQGKDYVVNGGVKYYNKKDNISTTLKNWTPTYLYNWTDKDGNTTTTRKQSVFTSQLISNQKNATPSYGELVWPENFNPVHLRVEMLLPTNELQKNNDDVVSLDNTASLEFEIIPGNDMGIPDLKLTRDDKNTSYPTPNVEHKVIVEVENFGEHEVVNPTIDVVIKDKNNDTFYEEEIPFTMQNYIHRYENYYH